MNIDANVNNAECIIAKKNILTTTAYNICNNTSIEVPNTSLEIAASIILGMLLTLFMLGIIIFVLGVIVSIRE